MSSIFVRNCYQNPQPNPRYRMRTLPQERLQSDFWALAPSKCLSPGCVPHHDNPLPPTLLQDAVFLTPVLCMGSHQPPSLTESKNIKPGPICWPTDEHRCAVDFRSDWQPVKAVRRGTCCPIPPISVPLPAPGSWQPKQPPPPEVAGSSSQLDQDPQRASPTSWKARPTSSPARPLCPELPL